MSEKVSIEDFKAKKNSGEEAPEKEQKVTHAESLAKLKEAVKEAGKSDKPYPVTDNNGEPIVVGDPNQASSDGDDYTLRFWLTTKETLAFPYEDSEVEDIGNDRFIVTHTFKNVTYNAKVRTRVMSYIVSLMPFFNKMKENGATETFDDEESLEYLNDHYAEYDTVIYFIVASFFDIEQDLAFNITPVSAIGAVYEIITNNPDLTNSADAFFK